MSRPLTVDLELVEKYDRPGPRYTSYPTALRFADTIGPADKQKALQSAAGPLSLYLHLPFCESLCWFCGCTKVITRSHARADDYLDKLEREIHIHHHLLGGRRTVAQLHFGGGTPNFLQAAQIDRLGDLLKQHFHFADGAECSVELDPRTLDRAKVEAFAAMGVKRASFGVQDINPEVQKAIHRIQPAALNREATTLLRAAGYTSVNIDLIYGLPLQTAESFKTTLLETLSLQPNRFAVFNYAHVPWLKPAQKKLEEAGLPSPREKMRILKMLIETLTGRGYVYIGMDHFVREDDELAQAQRNRTLQRNFQGYSTGADLDIVAMGMSAISRIGGLYLQNDKDLDSYSRTVHAGQLPVARGYRMSADDHRRADLIMRLMCDLQIDYAAWEARWHQPFRETFARELEALAPMEADGLVTIENTCLRVTAPGRLFLRNIAMAFDAYLDTRTENYSRTV